MAMKPSVERLEKELGIQIQKLETWHNEENQKKFEELAANKCMGVPFFINTDNGEFVCGEASFEELKAWALGEGSNKQPARGPEGKTP